MTNVEELAQRLIETLGVAGALKACRENMWLGAAEVISARNGQRLAPSLGCWTKG